MNYPAELDRIMETYREAVSQVEKNRRPFDGILGIGRSPSDDACHDQMDQSVAFLMTQAGGENGDTENAEKADAGTVDELISGLMRAAKEYQGPEYARIALMAAQRHGLPLIPKMTAEGRKMLLTWYDQAYPRRMRFPVQKEIVDLLSK